jgi:hypothetical protein
MADASNALTDFRAKVDALRIEALASHDKHAWDAADGFIDAARGLSDVLADLDHALGKIPALLEAAE